MADDDPRALPLGKQCVAAYSSNHIVPSAAQMRSDDHSHFHWSVPLAPCPCPLDCLGRCLPLWWWV